MGPVAVLLPVKSFAEAKLRLSPALDGAQRASLARAMATHVLAAAQDLPTAVVCDDVEVATWARDHGALVVWQPEQGLNRAVEAGVARLGRDGARRVIVAHADLAHADELAPVGRFPGVTLVPDRDRNGSNVVCVPADADFRFSYGPGSFQRHSAEARRLELPLRVLCEPRLAHDVDLPSDLAVTPAR